MRESADLPAPQSPIRTSHHMRRTLNCGKRIRRTSRWCLFAVFCHGLGRSSISGRLMQLLRGCGSTAGVLPLSRVFRRSSTTASPLIISALPVQQYRRTAEWRVSLAFRPVVQGPRPSANSPIAQHIFVLFDFRTISRFHQRRRSLFP